MQDLKGKVAVVTGGGGGIGRALALAFADEGMHVVAADLDLAAAEAVRDEVSSRGVRGLAVHADVADRASVEALASRCFEEMGGVHVLCNNAGVSVFGSVDHVAEADWRWVLSVNLEGVIHGIQAFVPRMRDAAQGGHIVNTASIAGQVGRPGLGIYSTTKFAVVGLSEALRGEVAPYGIGVSVLCPDLVRTRIAESARSRPLHLGGPETRARGAEYWIQQHGINAGLVGRAAVDAVRGNELYVFTHPENRRGVEQRYRAVFAAFDVAEARARKL
jgi:NAD(P)-dependent dehydrogenase (short-subunit alcohol dehydrogenase family)